MFDEVQKRIDALIWGDIIEQRGIPGRVLAVCLRYLYAILRDFFSGQLTLRAMSLVYTTLLSIVPLIAFSFSVLKGLGVHELLEQQLYGFLEPLGDKGAEYTNDLIELVNNVNGRVLGGMSLVFFVYTAISMVQKIEESFNYVWYVSKPRSFARRFTEYTFVLLIGPVLIVTALGMLTSLQNEAAVRWLLDNAVVGPLFVQIGKLMPYLMIAAAFTFLYMFMPNTRVHVTSAIVGGVAGGFVWATLSVVFAAVIANFTKTQAIYASFAVPITALIWLYLNWLILLVGAQLAFYYQNPAYMRHGRREPSLSNAMRERLALNIMYLVGREFREPKKGITTNSLAETLRIPSLTLAPVVAGLEQAKLLSVTENERLQPGREPSHIELADILSVVRVEGDTGSHARPKWAKQIEALGVDLDNATLSTVANRSLSDLLDESD